MSIQLTSPAFQANGPLPKKYTGEGADISPPLAWKDVPPGTKEFALICDDPDAPGSRPFVHWVAYKISPDRTALGEGDAGGALEGRTDFGKPGYGGPMPPRGSGAHRYFFKLYALNAPLQAGGGLTKDALLSAMKGRVLTQGELVGTYERK